MRITVLDGFAMNPGDLSWQPLQALGETRVFDYTEREQVMERAAGAEALLVGRTPLRSETLEQLPSLRYIGTLGTGYNMVDLACAKERGIVVCNAPGYSTMSVAQHAFALLLALTNHPEQADRAARSGYWTGLPDSRALSVYVNGLEGKTLGIIGYGSIGRQVACIALAFGMNVAATSRSHRQGGEDGMRFLPMDEVLKTADVLSLNCPLTDETRGMIDSRALGLMKPNAVLINTSRGPVVREEDLAAALNEGRLRAAGVDVLSCEPDIAKSPLATAKNCLITPHIAWTSAEARSALLNIVAANLRAFLNGSPQNRVG